MTELRVTGERQGERLSRRFRDAGIDVEACYQCGRCSAGCPVSEHGDLLPMEVVRLSSYGEEDTLTKAHAIWLCASCGTCTTRCPNDIDIAGVMDVLREWALRNGVPAAERRVALFHRTFLKSVRRGGRTYELGMLGAYKMKSGDLFSDIGLGLRMLWKGKLRFIRRGIRDRDEVKKIFKRTAGD